MLRFSQLLKNQCTRGYGFRQDIYDGECHSGIAEADAGHRPQQDACGAALRRIQGDVP